MMACARFGNKSLYDLRIQNMIRCFSFLGDRVVFQSCKLERSPGAHHDVGAPCRVDTEY